LEKTKSIKGAGIIVTVEDYYIITDTREQNSLTWRKNVKTETMNVGDYCCEYNGERLPLVFERKSPQDFLSSIVKGHERFKKEWVRAKEQGLRFIIIVECSYEDFIEKKFDGAYRSKLPPQILQKILHKSIVRHDLEIVFFNNRVVMQKYVRLMFNALVEEHINVLNKVKKEHKAWEKSSVKSINKFNKGVFEK